MKVAILTLAHIPEGLATTNRVYYHAKGLKENNVYVKIYVVKPTEFSDNIKNKDILGDFKGIPYEYSPGNSVRSKYFFQRRIDDILGPMKAVMSVIKGKYDAALMISSNSFYHVMLFKLVLPLFGVKFIAERTELPFHGKKNKGIYKIKNQIYSKFIYKGLNGFLAISRYLEEHYVKFVSKNCPIVLIPVIVDDKDIYRGDVERTKNLVYTGPLLQEKDGILTIIESFAMIANDYPETNLMLTGNIKKSIDGKTISKLISDNNLADRVILTGFISRDEMIDLLNSAVGLVLAKPSSDQADSCFPTKLGEYLATGNPIVVTSTGEIPYYLKDGENAYIANPDSVEDFAEKLKQLLDNPIQAKEIGKKGREVAKEKFNYYELSKKVIELIKNAK